MLHQPYYNSFFKKIICLLHEVPIDIPVFWKVVMWLELLKILLSTVCRFCPFLRVFAPLLYCFVIFFPWIFILWTIKAAGSQWYINFIIINNMHAWLDKKVKSLLEWTNWLHASMNASHIKWQSDTLQYFVYMNTVCTVSYSLV